VDRGRGAGLGDPDEDERLREQLPPGGALERLARTGWVFDAPTYQLGGMPRGPDERATCPVADHDV
jgi:hypothetical protein